MDVNRLYEKNRLMGRGCLFFLLVQLLVFPPAICAFQEAALAGEPSVAAGKSIIVYYFHGNYRCPTCLKLERLSRQAVEEGFSRELSAGVLEYRSVNVDEPPNRHFVDDFGLFTKSLVVVEEDGGKVKRYKNLNRIWVLVRDEKAFKDYVKEEIEGFIKDLKKKKEASSRK